VRERERGGGVRGRAGARKIYRRLIYGHSAVGDLESRLSSISGERVKRAR